MHSEKEAANLRAAVDRKKEITSQLGILVEDINLSEHETEQILLDYRFRLESVVTIYLQGTGKYIDVTCITENVLTNDLESADIYTDRCVLTEDLKHILMDGGIAI